MTSAQSSGVTGTRPPREQRRRQAGFTAPPSVRTHAVLQERRTSAADRFHRILDRASSNRYVIQHFRWRGVCIIQQVVRRAGVADRRSLALRSRFRVTAGRSARDEASRDQHTGRPRRGGVRIQVGLRLEACDASASRSCRAATSTARASCRAQFPKSSTRRPRSTWRSHANERGCRPDARGCRGAATRFVIDHPSTRGARRASPTRRRWCPLLRPGGDPSSARGPGI